MSRKKPAALKEGLKALGEEVDTWAPKAKEWPAVGDRVQLLRPHPWGGRTGVVVRLSVIRTLRHLGERPVVRLHDAEDVPHGREAFIMQADQWKVFR